MTEIYAMFMFEPHEASGGLDDLKLIGSMAECMALAEQDVDRHRLSQIALLPTLELVKTGEWVYTPSPLVGQPITWHYEWRDGKTPT